MVHYDHAMLGGTLAVAAGFQRRHGWPAVVLAALAGMVPDWDATTKHVRPDAYAAGHRVWGHNVFAATLAGASLGGVGYLILRSRSHRSAPPPADLGGAGPWVALGVAIAWSHPLLDLLYCGWGADVDWPVRLFWPVSERGFGLPWVPWSDWGATAVLAAGLLACALARAHRQSCAVATLAVFALYVGVCGAFVWR
jgi:hypothetical protein